MKERLEALERELLRGLVDEYRPKVDLAPIGEKFKVLREMEIKEEMIFLTMTRVKNLIDLKGD